MPQLIQKRQKQDNINSPHVGAKFTPNPYTIKTIFMETKLTLSLTATQMQRLFDVANVRHYEALHKLNGKGQKNEYKVILRHNENEKAQKVVDNALKLSTKEIANLRSIAKAVQAIDSLIFGKIVKHTAEIGKVRDSLFSDLKENRYGLTPDYKITKI